MFVSLNLCPVAFIFRVCVCVQVDSTVFMFLSCVPGVNLCSGCSVRVLSWCLLVGCGGVCVRVNC
ncbi:hypothetical protein M6B38_254770 [Iris pallida]|uniref:Secreted protein n=1 Tax=Iris pallida TaxID=29817 RepID=A0AAX6IH26_IRIPA|nr:hypothetical protein M6B38_254770 [Iris pallida]